MPTISILCYIMHVLVVDSISEVFGVEGLKEKQEQGGLSGGSLTSWGKEASFSSSMTQQPAASAFTGILYAYLTHLNIAGDIKNLLCYRW